jgi:hypothetical protein
MYIRMNDMNDLDIYINFTVIKYSMIPYTYDFKELND